MIRICSLFANVGIAESDIQSDDITIPVANEIIPNRAKYYKYMHPRTLIIQGDIRDRNIYDSIVLNALETNCNLLLATPPCQAMSMAGIRMDNDERNNLIQYVINFMKDTNIEYGLIENVQRMPKCNIVIKGKERAILSHITDELGGKYHIEVNKINCADYGVPQNRKRCFITLSRLDKNIFSLKGMIKVMPKTVRQAIGHLPPLESGQECKEIPYHRAKKHNDRHILWLQLTPTGKTAFDNKVHYPNVNGRRIKAFRTTYKRIWDNAPCPTITMNNGCVGSQNNCHYGNRLPNGTYDNARVLTLKEIFILMTLPDTYTPPCWATDNFIRGVVGEGIPPLMFNKILEQLLF